MFNDFILDMEQEPVVPDGIYSIRTADLQDQYYAIRTQSYDASFAPGQRLVYKVEQVKSYHEEQFYFKKGWRTFYNQDKSICYAMKPFAFVSDGGVAVWRRYRNEESKEIIQDLLADYTRVSTHIAEERLLNTRFSFSKIRLTLIQKLEKERWYIIRKLKSMDFDVTCLTPEGTVEQKDIGLPSKMLWENHAKVLWEFGLKHRILFNSKTSGVQHVTQELLGARRVLPEWIETNE